MTNYEDALKKLDSYLIEIVYDQNSTGEVAVFMELVCGDVAPGAPWQLTRKNVWYATIGIELIMVLAQQANVKRLAYAGTLLSVN